MYNHGKTLIHYILQIMISGLGGARKSTLTNNLLGIKFEIIYRRSSKKSH